MCASVRLIFAFALSGTFVAALPLALHAQGYPSRPVRIVVPYTAGGGVDTVSRVLAQKMGESTGQSFVIDNRPGGGGNIAYGLLANAEPDGYIVLNSPPAVVVNPTLYRKVPYKIDDFAAISLVGHAPMIVTVHPSLPVRSIADLVKLAKARPGTIRYGAPIAAASHLTMEVFRMMADIDIQRVPYKGAPQALQDVIGGQIEMTAMAVPATMPLVRANRVRALAQTGAKRSPAAPDIPTLDEAGVKGYDVTTWYVVFGPAAMPADAVNKLSAEIAKALKFADVQERLQIAGMGEIVGSTPTETAKFVKAEFNRWAKIIKATGMTVD